MAVVLSLNCHGGEAVVLVAQAQFKNPNSSSSIFHVTRKHRQSLSVSTKTLSQRRPIVNALRSDSDPSNAQDSEVNNLGVKAALSMLRFYKREISPLLPNSCRYVPTCSEYSMIAYKKYGVVKGTILTTWRLCRCNPLGGSGFDPPRWFGETSPPEE